MPQHTDRTARRVGNRTFHQRRGRSVGDTGSHAQPDRRPRRTAALRPRHRKHRRADEQHQQRKEQMVIGAFGPGRGAGGEQEDGQSEDQQRRPAPFGRPRQPPIGQGACQHCE